jgi:uncharacterized protein with FMN-binding domain
VILTLVGLGALLTFKSTAPASTTNASAHVHTTPTTTPPATAPPPSPTTSPTTGGGGNTPATPAPTSPPATKPPTPANTTRTVDGDPFDNRYGTVQVRLTLQGNQITNVDLLQMPSDRARSQFISEQAGPILQQETLQAQSAQIDTVSGASYTSESYAQSLQSALDKAHA